ncbi:MAG: hypothetical protein IPH44_10220 [Myxococcales bacterium]|nr:hypothetical protein [Myxococcales bacterium]MBK7195848.1 hypothetical protein [Myxococcales bacterium]MBP6842564.1 hypothetical protein [Kofleriaceae bacterium]
MAQVRFAALALFAATLAVPAVARADLGVGVFVGQPTGLDLKIGLERRTALDVVIGWDRLNDGRVDYAHATFLANLGVARGRSVLVPLRVGVGVAAFDGAGGFGDEVNLAVRAPIELGLRFRRTPIEIYGELALKLTLVDGNDDHDDVDGDGGIGLRVYF